MGNARSGVPTRGGSATPCGACEHCADRPGKLVRVTLQGELREGPPLPTLEQVLEAIEQVRRGVPVERATAGFAGDLWR